MIRQALVTQLELALEVVQEIRAAAMPHQVGEQRRGISMALFTGLKNPEVVVAMVLAADGSIFKQEVTSLSKERYEPMVSERRQVRPVEEAVEPLL